MDKSLIRGLIREILKEYITSRDLEAVEKHADSLFIPQGVDVEFSRHFVDRINDPRNREEITTEELKDLFTKLYVKYGQKIPNFRNGTHALVTDVNTNINIPFELKWNKQRQMFDMVNTTVLRTKKFFVSGNQAPHMKLKV
jgi:hypothetical protein